MDYQTLNESPIIQGDCLSVLRTFPDKVFQCCVTSPPYWGLRDYGVDGQLGLEPTPEEYIANMVEVFREVRRVLRDNGTLWINLGDSYWANRSENGLSYNIKTSKSDPHMKRSGGKGHPVLKPKDLVGIPWHVALALQADGWYLRSDIIWHKPNPMPESVTDRPTKAHEYMFLLSKSERYFYDHEAIKEPLAKSSIARLAQDIENQQGSNRANGGAKSNGTMKAVHAVRGSLGVTDNLLNSGRRENAVAEPYENRNKRSVWEVSTAIFSEAHFATFPPKLIEPCILAGSPQGGIVLDPFFGSGTTGFVAIQNFREFIGIELNPDYIEIAKRRLASVQLKLQIQEG